MATIGGPDACAVVELARVRPSRSDIFEAGHSTVDSVRIARPGFARA